MFSSIASSSTTPLLSSPHLQFTSHHCVKLHKPINSNTILKKPFTPSNLTLTKTHSSSSSFHFATHSEKPSDSDWEFREEEIEDDDDEGCPWEGAIMYRRNAGVSHLEYCTTLERLGLGKVSSEVSRTRASEMGLRVVKPTKDCPDGTPVLISVDVTRRKQKLRLDGIVRTVLALNCNRCGEAAAQSVYSDFSLLLCEEPIQEPDTINLGVIFGEDKSKSSGTGEAEDDEDALIDLDDQLYFPVEEKVIDISKNIRDLIHIEITINALCDPNCKGLCLGCGTNLNIGNCTCRKHKVEEKAYGPLRDLRKQMQNT
ncbi:Large ribosomal RNA subunit accumulation protein YCED1, chloroplastic [Sesamum alatum]|uniref:Large ribosomal RNA subunit accumulation protein YCED1, chloroplastic n=1 Tax=Sesamum alatum TaxID=300844 RepID=A0AAE1YD95_9LAMI|nr:Large ribosomal RNA subunit accumulation protein YCED1, chloroplastic [Sesamum alatum]